MDVGHYEGKVMNVDYLVGCMDLSYAWMTNCNLHVSQCALKHVYVLIITFMLFSCPSQRFTVSMIGSALWRSSSMSCKW